jgi:hypothetical protein
MYMFEMYDIILLYLWYLLAIFSNIRPSVPEVLLDKERSSALIVSASCGNLKTTYPPKVVPPAYIGRFLRKIIKIKKQQRQSPYFQGVFQKPMHRKVTFMLLDWLRPPHMTPMAIIGLVTFRLTCTF